MNDPWLKQIKCLLFELPTVVTFLWIPSHIGISGNDKADALANAGAAMEQSTIPVTQSIVQAKIKARKWSVHHERAQTIYGERRGPKTEIESKWPRDERRVYQQLRTGHCKYLQNYRYLIDLEDDAICDCGLGEEETLKHVLCKCPKLEEQRVRLAEGVVTTSMMVTDP